MPINDSVASEQWYRFRWCVENGHYSFLAKADRCDKFFAGMQWNESDLNALKLAKRPALTINKIISTISTIMGEQIYNRNEVTYRPSSGGLPETAAALTKVWMQIAQNNQLPWVRSDLFADGIIRSRGFYDVRMDFTDSMRGEVRISQLNSKNVVIDPDAEEYDPDMWNDVFITKWLTAQDIELLYNKEDADYLKAKESSLFPYAYDSIERFRDRFAGPMLQSSYYGMLDSHNVRRNIRVLERQYHLLDMQKHFVDVMTGDMRPIPDDWDRDRIAAVIEKAQGQISVFKKKIKRVRWTVTADSVVLHDDWSPYKHFTVVPYFPHFRYGQTIGLVENLLDPQELLNKVSSQELHVVNTSANSGWKTKAGNLVNMTIEELEQSGAKTGLVLELQDVSQTEKITPNQIPTGLDRISYKSEEHLKTISGVSDSMQGFDREDVAAKAIAYKKQSGQTNLVKVLDNLERTDFILARNVLDLVQQYYTEERIIHITHDNVMQEPETIVVNRYDPATDQIVNDLTLGEYSIVITSTPYKATLEDSQFEQAARLKEMGVAIPDSVLIENSRLMRKSDIIKQMEGDQNSPEAQAQKDLAMRGQAAEVSKAEAEVEAKRAETQLKLARAKKEIQGDEGETVELRKLRMEEEAALRAHDLERWKLEQEFALRREAIQNDIALKREQHEQEMALRREEAAQAAEQRRQDSLARRAAMLRSGNQLTTQEKAQ